MIRSTLEKWWLGIIALVFYAGINVQSWRAGHESIGEILADVFFLAVVAFIIHFATRDAYRRGYDDGVTSLR